MQNTASPYIQNVERKRQHKSIIKYDVGKTEDQVKSPNSEISIKPH